MLTLFRTKQDLLNILLLPYLLLIRCSIFFSPVKINIQSHGLLSEWMFYEIDPNSFSGRMLAIALIFFQAIFINILANRFRFSRELSLLPGMFYCLFCSLIPEFLALNGILLANIFVILALFYLLDVYKRNDKVANNIFDVGFWLGLASLFDYLYVFFLLWGIIGMSILLRLRFKDVLILLIGAFQPIFLLSVYLFYNDKLFSFIQNFTHHIGWLHLMNQNILSELLKLIFCFVCLGFALVMSGSIFRQQVLAVQKFLTIIYFMLLSAGLSTLFISEIGIENFILTAIPLGIIMGLIFQKLPVLLSEFLHLSIVIVSLLFQFEYLLIK